jgi:glycosyltransferase involved in cell wall biosynthesis
MVITTGRAALPLLQRYDLPQDRTFVVEPGTDPVPVARSSGGPLVQLLCVATLGPGKGHDVLIQALADQPHRNWRLTCAGSDTRYPATSDRLRTLTRDLGLEDRVVTVGDLDAAALGDCYDRADVFVLATRQETYGMAVAEAIARGLPVVSTRTGAIPELVGDDAGVVVAPGDTAALAAALTTVLGDARVRGRMAEGARRVRARLPTWEDAARVMNARLARLDTHG